MARAELRPSVDLVEPWPAELVSLAGDPSGPQRPVRASSAAPPLAERVLAWSQTPQGRSIARQLRWAAPRASVLLARLRAEMPLSGQTGDEQILRARAPLGVLMLDGESASWGVGQPHWDHVRQQVHRVCVCPGAPENPSRWRCVQCGGVRGELRLPPTASCPWCGAQATTVCAACLDGIHYRGECQRWMAGAHPVYESDPLESFALCPECYWAWAQQLPTPAPQQHHGVEALMRLLAARASQGAGESSSERRRRAALARRARRWISARLRSAAWVRVTQLRHLGAAALHARPHQGRSFGQDGCRAAVDKALEGFLCERRIWQRGQGRHMAVHWRRGESSAPARAVHVRARRRRRRRDNPSGEDNQPPRQVRRRVD